MTSIGRSAVDSSELNDFFVMQKKLFFQNVLLESLKNTVNHKIP